MSIINDLKNKNPDLKKAEITGILNLLNEHPGISGNDLIIETGLPKETLRVFKSSISHLLKEQNEDRLEFKEEGIPSTENLCLKPFKWNLLSFTDEYIQQRISEIRKLYGIEPKREFDQFFATSQTSISKAHILNEKGLVEDKNILLLGDDDLVSIALSLLNYPYKKITVVDIDDRLLKIIESIVKDLNLKNIETRLYDVRKDPRIAGFKNFGSYDVVLTDPPYTSSGIDLFLKRSIEFLGRSIDFSGKYIFLCYGNSFKSPEKSLKIQEIIQSYNLLIEDKIDKFNRYYGAQSIGGASSLYILKATPLTNTIEFPAAKTIYTHEERKEERFPYVDHFTFKILGVSHNLLNSRKVLIKLLNDFCLEHKIKVVDTKITQFKNKGLSITFILSNSNLLAHTWPEYNALHLDLITCTPIYNKNALGVTIAKLFGSNSIEIRKIE